MTRFLLCRHGNTDAVGRTLVGRAPGVSLNDRGRVEAQALAHYLRAERIDAVYSSPLERALETAWAIASVHALDVLVRDALNEFDFGTWTGKSLSELVHLTEFVRFNAHRSFTRAPGGEHVLEVQVRMVGAIEALASEFPQATLAVVGHADPLKTLLGHFLGLPLDHLQRLNLDPGSVSVLELDTNHVSICSINSVPPLA